MHDIKRRPSLLGLFFCNFYLKQHNNFNKIYIIIDMLLNYNLILDKILLDLLPLTKIEIHKGNKIFGAIIL